MSDQHSDLGAGLDKRQKEAIEAFENPLVELLTPSSKVKILAAFIESDEPDLNPSKICERAGIGRGAWYENKDKLLEYGVIRHSRDLGNSPMYEIGNSPIAELLPEMCSKVRDP